MIMLRLRQEMFYAATQNGRGFWSALRFVMRMRKQDIDEPGPGLLAKVQREVRAHKELQRSWDRRVG